MLNSAAEVLGLLGGFGFALTNVLLRQQARQPVASGPCHVLGLYLVRRALGWA